MRSTKTPTSTGTTISQTGGEPPAFEDAGSEALGLDSLEDVESVAVPCGVAAGLRDEGLEKVL
jgi:hypothetical protein